ncbi:hypothetical protein ACLOJK_006058 [Asimina triloba]
MAHGTRFGRGGTLASCDRRAVRADLHCVPAGLFGEQSSEQKNPVLVVYVCESLRAMNVILSSRARAGAGAPTELQKEGHDWGKLSPTPRRKGRVESKRSL